ncbi:MAG: PAS domain S-box protein [Alphaproteobacteria bacterium]|nr:PAS domain S-box protein [Alphaproteobacteria bacterium]
MTKSLRASQPAPRPDPSPDFDVGAALEAGEIGVWEWDLSTGQMRWSAQMFRNLGLEATAEGDLFSLLLERIHPSEQQRVAAGFAESRARPGPVRLEARLASSGGEPRWIGFLGRTVAGPDGVPTRMHGIAVDSTRRRRRIEAGAAALSESERRLSELNQRLQELAERRSRQLEASRAQIQAIFDNSPDWLTLFRATADGRFVYVDLNRATERAYGLSYDQVVGHTVEEILGPEQAQLPLRLMRESIRTGENQRYTARRTMAGVTRSIDVMFVRVPEQLDGGYHIMATARDITERDDLEERLRRERLLFELIIENTSEGIIVVDNELRHLLWNAAIENINGQPREAVLGKTVFEVFPHFADNPVGDAWRAALKGQRAAMRDHRFFSVTRGAEIVYDADFTPLYDQDSAIIGAICILRDITERHRIEHLSKLETVAQLTGGVAHDFNNLLTAAMGSLEMIARDSRDRRTTSLADMALRSIDRGAQLTQQLLTFSRRQALRPVSADLNELVAEIEVLIRRAVGETIDVVIKGAPALPRCEVDPAQFEAAVMNLVINARDAMPAGGRVRLTTRKLASKEIPAGAGLRPGDYVAFTVEDNGEGMPPEVAARALEPFYTTKEIGKGSGLGLSTVYGFATQSGGGLHIDSTPGAGTSVTLYLPVAAAAPDETRQERAADEHTKGSGSILVVEDDGDVRDVSIAILEALGYRTLVAGNGREAIEVLRGPDTIDLLFTDLVMPGGMSGVTLAREAQAIRPGLRVLLTTGYAGADAPPTAEFPIISKPFRSAELGRVIARLLREPAAADAQRQG